MKLIFLAFSFLLFFAVGNVYAQSVEPTPGLQAPTSSPNSIVEPSTQSTGPSEGGVPESLPLGSEGMGGESSKAIPVAIPEGESKPPVIPILPDDNFVYNASENRRDPFRPFGAQLASAAPVVAVPLPNSPDENPVAPKGPPPRSLEPLEYFEVDKIEVIALIWGVKKPRALVKDPSGGIHTIWLGQRIGPNQGKVISIREGELEVLEYFDQQGKTIEVPRTIALKKPVGGK